MSEQTEVAGLLGNRYQILSKLGAGAFGEVYKARDTLLNRTVAIKRIRMDAFTDVAQLEEVKERFLREAKVAAQLNHPNIVTIHDIQWSRELSFIVMEFIEGETLQKLLAAKKRLSLAETVDVLGPVADALDHAHQKKVVHRDIKPANIMIEPSGRPKVTDFGIAKLESAGTTNLTATGSILGTPNYMSPEQARGERELDGRSDLFSLGCILYECLAGEKPFRGESVTAVLMKILTEQAPPLDCQKAGLPRALAPVVQRGLAKSPAERYRSGRELVDALRAAAASASIAEEAPTLGGVTLGASAPPPATHRQPSAEATAIASPPPPPPLPTARMDAASQSRPGSSVTMRRPPTPEPAPRPSSGPWIVAAASVLVLAVGAGGLLVLKNRRAGRTGETTRRAVEEPASAPARPSPAEAPSVERAPTSPPTRSTTSPAEAQPETPPTPPRPAVSEPPATQGAPRSASTTPTASSRIERPPTTPAPSVPESPPPPSAAAPPVGPSTETEGEIIDGSTAGRRLASAYRKGGSSGPGSYGGARFQPRRAELRLAVNERAAVQRLLQIAELEASYRQEHGGYATPDQLLEWKEAEVRALGLQGRPWATFQGYRFRLELPRKDFFVAFAVPLQYGQTGALSFYIDPAGVIRGADKSGAPAAASDPPY